MFSLLFTISQGLFTKPFIFYAVSVWDSAGDLARLTTLNVKTTLLKYNTLNIDVYSRFLYFLFFSPLQVNQVIYLVSFIKTKNTEFIN